MNLELEKSILTEHPTIYRLLQPRFGDGQRFECGDGWHDIIAQLSGKLEAEARRVGHGDLLVVQVKEKFGALRVYLRGSVSDRGREWVASAEHQSVHACELCGSAGALRESAERGYARTLCASCARTAGYVLE
jgi:translation initiation factor IF-1